MLNNDKALRILVIGASQGIGLSIVRCLMDDGHSVVATCREPEAAQVLQGLCSNVLALDLNNDDSIQRVIADLHAQWPYVDAVIHCAGLLHDGEMQPEKRLANLTRTHLERAFSVNAIGHALILQGLMPLFKRAEAPRVIALSAKVGGIDDNQVGGWYAYRASKAALNMLMKTVSIEFERTLKHRAVVVCVHPGTTDTQLSKPFQGAVNWRLKQPDETAQDIVRILCRLTPDDNGTFIDVQGNQLPW